MNYLRMALQLVGDGKDTDCIVLLKGATEADLAAVGDWLRQAIELSRASGAPQPRVVMIDPDMTYTPGTEPMMTFNGERMSVSEYLERNPGSLVRASGGSGAP